MQGAVQPALAVRWSASNKVQGGGAAKARAGCVLERAGARPRGCRGGVTRRALSAGAEASAG
jgi:hypothetical protein